MAVSFGITGYGGGEMVYGPDETAVKGASSNPASTTGGKNLMERAADYRKTLVKMNSKMWNSRTHGHRWVNTYVSREAVGAYHDLNPLPVGSLAVKESFEDVGGKPSSVSGPLYVMFKGKTSESPQLGGWQFALEWDHPVPGDPEGISMPVKWLPGDPHLNSCVKCHNHFKAGDYLGGIPEGCENP
jgi:hypothetical protein